MITCQHARHLFDSYLDGELSASLQTELHAHRLNCTACQNELALLEACGDVIAMDRRESQISASFTDRVLLAQRGRQMPRRRRWGRVALLVGSPMAAAASVVFMLTVVSAPTGSVRPTAIAPYRVTLPENQRKLLLNEHGRTLTDQEKQEIAQAKEMPPSAFAEALQGAGEGVKSKLEGWRRVFEESGRLVTGYSNERLAALQKNMQKEKAPPAGAPEGWDSDVIPLEPSYLNQPPAPADPAGRSDRENPVEAL
jgi:hypothetical protein